MKRIFFNNDKVWTEKIHFLESCSCGNMVINELLTYSYFMYLKGLYVWFQSTFCCWEHLIYYFRISKTFLKILENKLADKIDEKPLKNYAKKLIWKKKIRWKNTNLWKYCKYFRDIDNCFVNFLESSNICFKRFSALKFSLSAAE